MTLLAQVAAPTSPAITVIKLTPEFWTIVGLILFGCFAIRMLLEVILPATTGFLAQLRMTAIQLIVAGFGLSFSTDLIPQRDAAIMVGCGCSGFAVQFYSSLFQFLSQTVLPKFLSWLASWISQIFGSSNQRPAEPLEPDPSNPKPPTIDPQKPL